jgi:hypothetical protein
MRVLRARSEAVEDGSGVVPTGAPDAQHNLVPFA